PDRTGGHPRGTDRLNHHHEESHDGVVHHAPGLDRTPHWFRHTHATALLLAGTPEWVVSRRLGHAHVQTTLDLYGWVRDDEALRAAANWASYASSWRVAE
ncbi:tyrosine-type recombinase/integrase, partial [Mycolicibacterium pallens]|uniref:tyrosine-type recombinase/integrase n=1 Tax=Mycolicibacterium pallens TaxID=370524 RepID=UPI0031DF0D6B